MPEQRQRRYAERTTIDPMQTQAEIGKLVERHKATGFIAGWQGAQARVMFEMRGRRLRFSITLPPPDDRRFTKSGHIHLSPQQSAGKYEQFKREQWRLLLLLIKSKLEAIQNGAAVFEEEMMPYTVMPNGQTVLEWLGPQLEDRLRNGTMPPLLPG